LVGDVEEPHATSVADRAMTAARSDRALDVSTALISFLKDQ
jgi:hypothetical protein